MHRYAAVAHLVERHLAKVERAVPPSAAQYEAIVDAEMQNDGFFVSCGNGRECPQRCASVGSGAASAVFHHDPT